MISQITNSNTIAQVLDPFQNANNSKHVEEQQDNPIILESMLDEEAQEALYSVHQGLYADQNQSMNVHSNLNLSKVMSLLEGL